MILMRYDQTFLGHFDPQECKVYKYMFELVGICAHAHIHVQTHTHNLHMQEFVSISVSLGKYACVMKTLVS